MNREVELFLLCRAYKVEEYIYFLPHPRPSTTALCRQRLTVVNRTRPLSPVFGLRVDGRPETGDRGR